MMKPPKRFWIMPARPDVMFAPQAFFSAGRIYERAGRLDDAASIWESMADKYPGSDLVCKALFQPRIATFGTAKIDRL